MMVRWYGFFGGYLPLYWPMIYCSMIDYLTMCIPPTDMYYLQKGEDAYFKYH